ncbi:(2Fe-2S)-binding protein [bacterium]|nr:(2Fe-2S)-binding protein [candidate division CSSED10-310 bacterium]
MAKIDIFVNDQPVSVKEGTLLLKVLEAQKISVPTLCHHKDLKPEGSCRLCSVEVEVDEQREMVTSCNYPVREPIRVWTETETVIKHRRMLAEMLLGRWPNVPAIKKIARQCGVTESRFTSDLTDPNPKACILCTHCVRACAEFAQEHIIDFAGRGIKRHVAMPFEKVDPHCIGCTSCAYVCPTGALRIVDDLNNPVNPTLIRNHGMKVNAEMATLDAHQCRMREVGTANIVSVMNAYDLLPVMNYRFGTHEEVYKIDGGILKEKYFTQNMPDGCWKGCSMACAKTIDNFELRTGPYKGQLVTVDGPEYETAGGGSNMGLFDMDAIAEFNFYCDTYGIDTISGATCIAFVMEAYEAGIIDKTVTGGLDLHFGQSGSVLELLHQMSRGEGFGVDVGHGIRWLKKHWGETLNLTDEQKAFLQDIGMEVKGLEVSEYMCKESLAQQLGYGMAVKGPQHDEAWLIFMDMVNNEIPTYEDKAQALYYFPLWRTWFGLYGLCKLCWNDVTPADNKMTAEPQKVPDHVNNYFKFVEGMTGRKLNEEIMLNESARVHNLQRLMCLMLGKGRRNEDYMPYRGIGPVTKVEYESRQERYDKQLKEVLGIDPAGKTTEQKMALIREYREEQYDKTLDVVYKRRGWDPNGVPTVERLKELGIDMPELVAIVEEYKRSL